MPNKLNLDTWPRKEHFEFFCTFEEPFFGLIAAINCTKAYTTAKQKGIPFFLYYLHKTLVAVNSVEAFKYRIANGEIWVHEQVNVSATLTRDDNTFGFSFMQYYPDVQTFVTEGQKEIERVRNTPGLKEMRSFTTMDESIAYIAALPTDGKPGTVFRYSNTGLQIAAAVLEKISGKGFEQLFAERIATPLQMKDTDFGRAKVPLPAGGAHSTANDYTNFLSMILNKGMFNGKRILAEKSIADMQVNRITADVKIGHTAAEAPGIGYGFGEWVYGGGTVSSPGLFGCYPWVDNSKKYAAVLMVLNLKHDGRQKLYAELKQLVDEAVK